VEHEPELVEMSLRRCDIMVVEIVLRVVDLPRHRREPDAERRDGERRQTVALAAHEHGRDRDRVQHRDEGDRIALRRQRGSGEDRTECKLAAPEEQGGAHEQARKGKIRERRQPLVARRGHPKHEAQACDERPRRDVRT